MAPPQREPGCSIARRVEEGKRRCGNRGMRRALLDSPERVAGRLPLRAVDERFLLDQTFIC